MHAQDVKSLVTFYYMYHRQPVGRYVLKVCRSISCYLCGANQLIESLEKKLDIKLGETTADGQFTLVGGECLAACTGAPCLQINDRFFEHASETRVDELLAKLRTPEGDGHYPRAVQSWRGEREGGDAVPPSTRERGEREGGDAVPPSTKEQGASHA